MLLKRSFKQLKHFRSISNYCVKVQNVLKKAVDSVLTISGPIEFVAVSFVLVWQMAFTCLLPLETIEFVTMVQ